MPNNNDEVITTIDDITVEEVPNGADHETDDNEAVDLLDENITEYDANEIFVTVADGTVYKFADLNARNTIDKSFKLLTDTMGVFVDTLNTMKNTVDNLTALMHSVEKETREANMPRTIVLLQSLGNNVNPLVNDYGVIATNSLKGDAVSYRRNDSTNIEQNTQAGSTDISNKTQYLRKYNNAAIQVFYSMYDSGNHYVDAKIRFFREDDRLGDANKVNYYYTDDNGKVIEIPCVVAQDTAADSQAVNNADGGQSYATAATDSLELANNQLSWRTYGIDKLPFLKSLDSIGAEVVFTNTDISGGRIIIQLVLN